MSRQNISLEDILLLEAVGDQAYSRSTFRRRVIELLGVGVEPAAIAKRLGKRSTVYAIAKEQREKQK